MHAEEITVQNEQLLKAQGELEEARDRFADLYDFAPIGYVSLDHIGLICEINLAGAALLGRTRANLINLPLAALLSPEDKKPLQDFLREAISATGTATPAIEVKARTDARKILRLLARPGVAQGRAQLFTAMMDVTEERRLESDRAARSDELEREAKERRAAETRVKFLLERLVTAQEEERRRISRNLHDHLGQQLTALKLTLNSLHGGPTLPAGLRERLERAEHIVTRLDRDIDLLAWDLRPATLDLGLTSALADLVRQWSAVTEVPAEFHQSVPGEVRLPADTEANIYRIVQEALNNIAKHAHAAHVSVIFEQHAEDTLVVIEDNGRGFDPERLAAAQGQHSGMGLVGMHERAALFDGTVHIESTPGHGTTIFVRVPQKRGPEDLRS